ncbi:hypothetical protein PPL_02069 [Heterostelium album PN500]|uniref:Uncharacterized protein n=1 Tax=Heterostelium pallidum (strain ATCC 26659 / Pp 5 / PN500) TaxID=670386 RepID=D3B198_HETP5|nr:hypothetical protein PPL_02069 [Heterostelium album PN500]EFA85072.1 hypothetical protein PPL_02069 [Heterostelium album PN500]|eukprot:XP_020437182.1 hypothetical protein PPL_02069 [Heterostelium album PN500]
MIMCKLSLFALYFRESINSYQYRLFIHQITNLQLSFKTNKYNNPISTNMFKYTSTFLLVLLLVAFTNAQYDSSTWTFTFGTLTTPVNVRVERSLSHVALQTSSIRFGPLGGTSSIWINDAIKSTTTLPNPAFNPVDYVMGFSTVQIFANGSACFPKIYQVRAVISFGIIHLQNIDGTPFNIQMTPTTIVQVDNISFNWIV